MRVEISVRKQIKRDGKYPKGTERIESQRDKCTLGAVASSRTWTSVPSDVGFDAREGSPLAYSD
ncbi:hypothetical protein Scep_006784 [Stephania cephalantha]|uniref:Uncharacterized protein n=1 Tax=Stephania cephalantha TaxID=152367 RepID=A0AAP0PL56_9MAGN